MNLTEKYPKHKAYPPTPNWYSSNVTAIVDPHLFLYATRNTVVALDLNDMRYFNSFTVSNEKVQAIAAHEMFCFTSGVDKTIRIWNIVLGTLLSTYTEHRAEVTVLKLIRNGSVSVSGDKSGQVVVIDAFGKMEVHSETKVKAEITSLSATCVDGKDYVAIGYANGMIFVEEIGQDLSMTTVFQLTDGNDAIQSLDWQKLPSSTDPIWPLLASSTKRKKAISIWTFPSQSRFSTIKLPNPPAQVTDQQKSTVWIELSWSPNQPTKLFFSSYIGAVVCFEVCGRNPKIVNSERLEKHNRNVFTISWYNEGRNCITTSLDKQIIKWDVKKKGCLQCLKTQAAFPYSLDSPVWNEGLLAVGMGDNSIKLWNFSNMGSIMNSNKTHDYYNATVLWKGLQGKIEKIKWHPSREGRVAYANEYGHVGMYDTHNSKHLPFRSYHNHQSAPIIDWGSNLSDVLEDSEMMDTFLSLGGDGIIHVYDTDHPGALPINLNDRLREKNEAWFTVMEATDTYRTVFKISENYDFVAIGHSNGLLEIYDLLSLKVVFASNYQRSALRSLEWKKNIKDEIFLASGSDDGTIVVYTVHTIDKTKVPDIPNTQKEPLYQLSGHKKGILDLKWSRHMDKLILASASSDNFVIVWDVSNQTVISLFDNHRSRVLCVAWSLINHDVLFSGSEDRFIYEWSFKDFVWNGSIQAHTPLYDREKYRLVNKNNKRKSEAVKTEEPNKADQETAVTNEPTVSKKQKVAKVSKESYSMIAFIESEKSASRLKRGQHCLVLANNLMSGKVQVAVEEIKTKYLTEEQLQESSVVRYTNVFDTTDPKQQQTEIVYELLYGDKNDVRRLAELEVEAIEKIEGNPSDPTFSIENDIKNGADVKLAMDIMNVQLKMFEDQKMDKNINSCLTDWIVLALSPMDGKQKWIDLMLKQAEKLEKLKQYHLSASCYIACSHIYKAIELYRKNSMYKEAIVLAKLRLPSKDPIVQSLFADWAKELQKGDQDTLTAACYLLSDIAGSTNNAISALARSGKESGLFYAACLAVASDEPTKDQRLEQWLKKLNERLSNKKKEVS